MLEGPASALGLGMQKGLNAAFDEINAKGGVHGRKIKLISVNDGYEPDRAIAATKKLIEEDKVFALIGPVGTPTSAAAQPIATAAKVPFMGAFTGAGFLRNPKLENVINVRASYDAETEAWVKHLTEDLKISKIAHLLPGRRVRPRRPLRLQEGDGQAQHADRRRGDLRAQHRRGEDRRARA